MSKLMSDEAELTEKNPYDEFIQTIIDRLDKTMSKELDNIKTEFLDKVKAAETEKLKIIYEEYRAELRKEVELRQNEVEQYQRIVNIQAALLSKILEEDRDSVLRVLHNANLSEDELMLLSGDTKMRRERS